MNNFFIGEYSFNETGRMAVENEKYGKDWPVVYLIHNDKELYIGETQNAYKRFEQHLKNPDRKKLRTVNIVFDSEFNKSAVLDIEQYLIQLCGADQKYILQNLNGGQSEKHNYYQREKYINKIDQIWLELTKLGLTNNTLDDIQNTDLFKYSPYNTLTVEQNEVCREIIYDIIEKLTKGINGTSVIKGGAGTGKTILLINMIFKLVNARQLEIDFSEEDEALTDNTQMIHDLKQFITNYGHELKIGYVVPMTSIRKTLKTVFKKTKNGLRADMVIGPFDVFKEEYDVLFVDEAHRLAQYKNIGFRKQFKLKAEMLGKTAGEVTQLDMIVAKSKYRILVYDRDQTVKGSDITNKQFTDALSDSVVSTFTLTEQMRCKGGVKYTDYINAIFDCKQKEFLEIENCDLKLFEDVDEMVNAIKKLDKKMGLCRNAAGYSWEWISKGMKYKEAIAKGMEDIQIGPYKYVWNMTNSEFILSANSINEIGCIHTLQGYDLNYVGLIIGREIDYDPATNRIVIDLDKFYDKYVKQGCDQQTVENYIINSYKVIMTRGIKGCYVYACNTGMQEYLKRFMRIEKNGKA